MGLLSSSKSSSNVTDASRNNSMQQGDDSTAINANTVAYIEPEYIEALTSISDKLTSAVTDFSSESLDFVGDSYNKSIDFLKESAERESGNLSKIAGSAMSSLSESVKPDAQRTQEMTTLAIGGSLILGAIVVISAINKK